jgi:hypothetical protein
MPEHDSDYDGAWKEALRSHFPQFVAKYFPAMHAAIDWTAPLEWLDKEVSQVLGQAHRRSREVDVLVKVRLHSGSEQWILVHLEIQTSYEEGFEVRVSLYNGGLFWVFGKRVVTLVVLADLRESWLPQEDVFQVADFESRLKFPVCKLVTRLETDWRGDSSLPVQLARAQIAALRTAGDPEGRYRAKWQLVRGLYELGYNAEQVRELFRLIDWMIHLREDLSMRFEQDLTALEASLKMPYVTSVERIAEARGEARGEVRGSVNLLLRQIRKICGPVPEGVADRVRNLSLARLETLSEAVMTLRSLPELEAWLDAGDRPTER